MGLEFATWDDGTVTIPKLLFSLCEPTWQSCLPRLSEKRAAKTGLSGIETGKTPNLRNTGSMRTDHVVGSHPTRIHANASQCARMLEQSAKANFSEGAIDLTAYQGAVVPGLPKPVPSNVSAVFRSKCRFS